MFSRYLFLPNVSAYIHANLHSPMQWPTTTFQSKVMFNDEILSNIFHTNYCYNQHKKRIDISGSENAFKSIYKIYLLYFQHCQRYLLQLCTLYMGLYSVPVQYQWPWHNRLMKIILKHILGYQCSTVTSSVSKVGLNLSNFICVTSAQNQSGAAPKVKCGNPSFAWRRHGTVVKIRGKILIARIQAKMTTKARYCFVLPKM